MPSIVSQLNPLKFNEALALRHMTKAELANLASIHRQTITALLAGKVKTDSKAFQSILEILKLPSSFFISEEKQFDPFYGHAYRSYASATQKDKKQIEAIQKILQKGLSLIGEYYELPVANLIYQDLVFFRKSNNWSKHAEQIELLSQKLREHWGIGVQPIYQLLTHIENNGIPSVVLHHEEFNHVDASSFWIPVSHDLDIPLLLSTKGSKKTAVRMRFDFAHELGHLVLHKSIDWDLYAKDRTFHKQIESEANYFASAFLMPKEAFLKDVEGVRLNLFTLQRLKQKWHCSMQAIIMRCEQLGVIYEDEKTSLFKAMSYKGWKQFEPLDGTILHEEPSFFNTFFTGILQDDQILSIEDIENYFHLYPEEIKNLFNINPELFQPKQITFSLNPKRK
jgi:Zn-dependent peptidase ImmA (M78 family)